MQAITIVREKNVIMSSEYKDKTNYVEMRLDKLSLIIYLKEQ